MISTQAATFVPRKDFLSGCGSYSNDTYSSDEYSNFNYSTVSHSSLNFKRKRSLIVEPTHKHTPRPIKRMRVSLEIDSKTNSNEKTLLNSALASLRFSQGARIIDLSSGESLKEVNENYTTNKATRKSKLNNLKKDIEYRKEFSNFFEISSKPSHRFYPTSPYSSTSPEELDSLPTLVVEPSTRITSMDID
ncbi:hypothetical protein K7432_013724 [Basidiobolus ranarum]|uniref:Uncharacterized protein n=1 Tax=Basidiobolus ranarum TaxID=34480 RepID=A0ABR2VR59_9FUNG